MKQLLYGDAVCARLVLMIARVIVSVTCYTTANDATYLMSVTRLVLKFKGWLKAVAPCNTSLPLAVSTHMPPNIPLPTTPRHTTKTHQHQRPTEHTLSGDVCRASVYIIHHMVRTGTRYT